MNFRIYFNGSGLGIFALLGPVDGWRFTTRDGTWVDVNLEDGMPYIERHLHPGQALPVLISEIEERLAKATILDRVYDLDHMAMIKPGAYAHSTANARVRRQPQENPGRDYVEVYVEGDVVADAIALYDSILDGTATPRASYAKSIDATA